MDTNRINHIAANVWGNFAEIYPALVRYDVPKIILCNRLTRTAGKCYQFERKIHLGHKFFAKNHNEMVLTILPHELAHQVDFDLFGESEKSCGHGKKWQKIMVQYGLAPNKYHSLTI